VGYKVGGVELEVGLRNNQVKLGHGRSIVDSTISKWRPQ
jgi:hypothetical protein